MKPARLTRRDRWMAKAGSVYAYLIVDWGQPDATSMHLFGSLRSRDWRARRWAELGVRIVGRGRITFKKTFRGDHWR